ncbi:MAG: hypothetical protein ACTS42_01060 [Candidatus Hodgkinia cicadicola]
MHLRGRRHKFPSLRWETWFWHFGKRGKDNRGRWKAAFQLLLSNQLPSADLTTESAEVNCSDRRRSFDSLNAEGAEAVRSTAPFASLTIGCYYDG